MKGESTPLLISESISRKGLDGHRSSTVKLFSRWQSFAGVCLYVSMVGTTYAFSIYSTLLVSNLSFTDDDLYWIASIGNTGLYLSVVSGMMLEAYGIRVVITLGAVLIFAGFLYIYLAVILVAPANFASIAVAFFFSQFGVCCHISSAVTMSVRLFPYEARGASVGLAKGYFALSSAVLGDLAAGYFSQTHSFFVLFIALALPTLSFLGLSVVNELPAMLIPFDYEKVHGHSDSLQPFFYHWTILFVFIFILGYTMYAYDLSIYEKFAGSTVVSVTVLCLFFVLPGFYGSRTITVQASMVAADEAIAFERHTLEDDGSTVDGNDLLGRVASADEEAAESELPFDSEDLLEPSVFILADPPDQSCCSKLFGETKYVDKTLGDEESLSVLDVSFFGRSLALSQAVNTWRFWVLYVAFFVLCGTSLMVIDNVNEIAEALSTETSTFFVTCVSLANGLGRVSAGYISDLIVARLSKLQFMSLVAAMLAVVHGLFAIGSTLLLYPCLLLLGYFFGCSVVLVAVNIVDLFGSIHVATNFGAIDSAPIFGSYFFVTAVTSMFYYTNTTDDGGNATCIGSNCFRIPFIINGLCCALTSVALYFAHITTPIKKHRQH